MKAENLMMQKAPAPAGAGASLRSAAKTRTAAQSTKTEGNDFGSALDNAKETQKDTRPEAKDTGKAEGKESPKPEKADAKQPETNEAAEKQPAEGNPADAKETEGAKTPEEAAAAAGGTAKDGRKDKTAKADDAKEAKTVAGETTEETAATELSAMLMAMAGAAQSDAAQTETVQAENTELQPVNGELPQTAVPETAQSPAGGALEALIPQDAAKEQQAAQNQQLMDMLAGNGAEKRLTSEQLASLTSKVQEGTAAVPEISPEQQQVPGEAQPMPGMQAAELSIRNGETLADQPETAELMQDAGPRISEQALRNLRNETDTTAGADRRGEGSKSLFAGVPLTVEDVSLDTAGQDPRQNLGDMMNRQPQQSLMPESSQEVTAPGSEFPGEELFEGGRQTGQTENSSSQGTQQTPMGAGAIPQGMSFTESMNAAAPQEAAPVQQPADPYNVMRQIVDQARLVRTDANTEMVIRLNPEHLGELTLRVAVTAGGLVSATFHTENAQVRGLLESSMIQLKQELQQQGLKVDSVDVQSGLSEDFFAQSQAGQQGFQQSQQSARNRAADRQRFEDDADALTVNPVTGAPEETGTAANVGDAEGVNYLV